MILGRVSAQDFEGFGIDSGELFSGLWSSIPTELIDKINLMLDLSIAVLIAVVIYLVILLIIKILRYFIGSKESRILKRIEKDVEEILMILSKGRKIEKKEVEKKRKV